MPENAAEAETTPRFEPPRARALLSMDQGPDARLPFRAGPPPSAGCGQLRAMPTRELSVGINSFGPLALGFRPLAVAVRAGPPLLSG